MPVPSAPTVKPSDTVKVKKISKPRPTQISERLDPGTSAALRGLFGGRVA